MKISFNDTPCNDKDIKIVEQIALYVNNGGISPLKAGRKLADVHRALHLTILKLFIGFIRTLAVNYYKGKFDERNRVVSRHAADVYDYLIEQKIVDDDNYIADTL